MAIVYKARNTGTGKACALKVVSPHLVSRPELVELFVKEAQIAGLIGENPYVVNVFDAGVDDERGVPFMAMELLRGETLDQYVESRGPMPRTLVRTLFEQLADALDQAHGAGVIHRDLKPSNLFLTHDRRGRPVLKIMDFGIAKVLEKGALGTATRIGSPAYAAPEQQASAGFRKLAAKHGVIIMQGVSPATDVWALGLVAYELLTGLPKGHYWATQESLNDILIKVALEEHEPASVRAGDRASLLPVGFDEWFARCMRKNADERWPTPGQAVAALRRLLAPSDIEIESTQPLDRAQPKSEAGAGGEGGALSGGNGARKVSEEAPPTDPALTPDVTGAHLNRPLLPRVTLSPLASTQESARPSPAATQFSSPQALPQASQQTPPQASQQAPTTRGAPLKKKRAHMLRISRSAALRARNSPVPRTVSPEPKPAPLALKVSDTQSPAVQTRGAWTQTPPWPRHSKVAVLVGVGMFLGFALLFMIQSPEGPLLDKAASAGTLSPLLASPKARIAAPLRSAVPAVYGPSPLPAPTAAPAPQASSKSPRAAVGDKSPNEVLSPAPPKPQEEPPVFSLPEDSAATQPPAVGQGDAGAADSGRIFP